MKKSEGICEICGHCVGIRQKAHIIAEGKSTKSNILMLCPSCHMNFDTQLKPKLHTALTQEKAKNLPTSWKKSIYRQAADASMKARKKTKSK